MTEYRRASIHRSDLVLHGESRRAQRESLVGERIDALRAAFRYVQKRHPFRMEAVVILPDHLQCIWTWPLGNSDFSTRWSLIKGQFSRAIEKGERISQSRLKRGERGLWQRRFWQHHKLTKGTPSIKDLPIDISSSSVIYQKRRIEPH